MAVNLSPIWGAGAQLLDNSGNVLSGGKIYTYAAGTTTQVTTYTSSSGNTANSNPIILNSAGRVPYEIWLTDGQNYKFVLKDSNDVLIGTWNNLSGINSNFIAYTNEQEIQTATAGQTVFNLTTMNYFPATNSLSVFVDGVNQYGPGASYAYEETDSNTVTFTSGLHDGAEVKFTSSQIQNAGVADASQITYDPPFTNAVATNVEAKLAQTVSVKDFGAVGDGVTDDTDAIQNAIDAIGAEGGGVIYFPAGTYLCSGVTILYDAVHLVGSGRESTTVQFTGSVATAGIFSFGQDSSGTGALTAVSNCSVEKMSIDGNRAAGIDSQGVRTTLLDGFTLDDVHVYDCKGGYGFSIVGTGQYPRNDLRVLNCSAQRCGADGLDIKAGMHRITVNNFYTADHLVESTEENDAVGIDLRGNYINVSNVISKNCPTVGFRVRTNVGDLVTPPGDWTETENAKVNISNVVVYDSQQDGFQFLSPLNSVINASNIHAINCVRYGIVASGGDYSAGDIYISNASATGNDVGLSVGDAKFISISNMTTYGNGSDGVRITTDVNNCAFNGLKTYDNTRYGIYFLQTNADSVVTIHNSVSDGNGSAGLFSGATMTGNINVTNTAIQNESYGIRINNASTAKIVFNNGAFVNNVSNIQDVPASAKFNNVLGYVNKNNGSVTVPVDSTGGKNVTITHGLSTTPSTSSVMLTLGRNTNVADYSINWIRVNGTSSTAIDATVYVGTASSTGGALANLNWFVDLS